MRRGFTLIELLVVIAIIGMVATAVFVTLRSSVEQAKGANIVQEIKAIEKAMTLKALHDNINEWWHEDDFPHQASWSPYIEDIVDTGFLEEFLPIAPENDDGELLFSYAYDQDNSLLDTSDTDCYGEHLSTRQKKDRVWDGPNLAIAYPINVSKKKFTHSFDYLDGHFDQNDGPYCGVIRTYAFDTTQNHPAHWSIRYYFDEDTYTNY